MNEVTLERFAYSPMGTFGRLAVADFLCYTVERPWAGNAPNVSCIPEGTYPLRLRPSGVVSRTSGFDQGYEIADVPDRSLIMIHVGNTMDDVEGCVAVGDALGYVHGKWAVINSRATFGRFMDAMDAGCQIKISFKRP